MRFKCKQTNNIYEFTQEHDIQAMLKHPDYEVVKEEDKSEEDKPKRKYTKE